jgi:hypothetical protein
MLTGETGPYLPLEADRLESTALDGQEWRPGLALKNWRRRGRRRGGRVLGLLALCRARQRRRDDEREERQRRLALQRGSASTGVSGRQPRAWDAARRPTLQNEHRQTKDAEPREPDMSCSSCR